MRRATGLRNRVATRIADEARPFARLAMADVKTEALRVAAVFAYATAGRYGPAHWRSVWFRLAPWAIAATRHGAEHQRADQVHRDPPPTHAAILPPAGKSPAGMS